MAPAWPAIEHAHRARRARVPFVVDGRIVGSVAADERSTLTRWPRALRVTDAGVELLAPAAERDLVLADVNAALRHAGLIKAWRDETFPLYDPATLRPLALIERAATRFWGTLTLGAHATGFVADAHGRPAQVWIAQRARTKATDPGMLDNLVGGGVPSGQSPWQTLQREGFEEAGLDSATMRRARPGRVMRLARDIPEGFQQEWVCGYDLELAAGQIPVNQDGEVEGFRCVPLALALEWAAGDAMTVDAALVMLDFALRHGAIGDAGVARRAAALFHPDAPVQDR